jgi:quinoprotein glucose dehydrogenase
VIYALTQGNAIVVLDAATGKELWSHPNTGAVGTRGMNYWESKDRVAEEVTPVKSADSLHQTH